MDENMMPADETKEETPAVDGMPAAEGDMVEGEVKKDDEETETEAPAM